MFTADQRKFLRDRKFDYILALIFSNTVNFYDKLYSEWAIEYNLKETVENADDEALKMKYQKVRQHYVISVTTDWLTATTQMFESYLRWVVWFAPAF